MNASPILIIHHRLEESCYEKDRLITYLAKEWNNTGIPTDISYGISWNQISPIGFLHLDLSVVPDAYRKYAGCFPSTVNGRIIDIRKHLYCGHKIEKKQDFAGPVIAKSNYNYNAAPERRIRRNLRKIPFFQRPFLSSQYHFLKPPENSIRRPPYEIFEDIRSVPQEDWGGERIVEKFLPEKEKEKYVLRFTFFLGNNYFSLKMTSSERVIKHSNIETFEESETPPELISWIREKGLDYGKIDYSLPGGKLVIYDVNKTPAASLQYPEWRNKIVRALAPGIHDFFKTPFSP